MAAALVGGSFLSAFLQVLFDRMASPEFMDFFKSGRLIDGLLLTKLKATLISVNGLLDDAEEKQIAKPAVRMWLNELKDAVFEADDLLDEIAYEARRKQMETGSQIIREQFWYFFSSHSPFMKGLINEVETKLKEVLDRLEHLVKQKDALGLIEGIGEKPSSRKLPSTSLVDESCVYGRDDDKEAIVTWVLSDDENGNRLSVVPIVGMGGLGKTTLAQLVFNDRRVEEWFDIKAWVCVSEEFNLFKVTKDILKEVGFLTCDNMTANQLQLEVKKTLMEKKFLLVLDDVWNDKYADWDVLLRPLKSGAEGSKIVVTTRNESVASVTRTVPPLYLKELSIDDCWLVFAKHAFNDGNSSAHPELEIIGREIAKKCEGLPLAAKTLGGLLRSERDAQEWKKVSKSKLWHFPGNDVLPALRLSYHYLPSHLKRCFAYCALFPKNYKFQLEELVLLWMGEGFLVQLDGNKETAKLGEDYFHDLVSRSLFQQASGSASSFVMHDLIHDLAEFVSGEFCFRLEGEDAWKATQKTRHLSYIASMHDAHKQFEGIYEAQHLRTFMPLVGWRGHIDDKVTHDLLPSLKCLRVLSLSRYHNVTKLSSSIGKLKHLRYLNLSATSMEKLPKTVSTLYNLQILILKDCNRLVKLPDSIGNLMHLQYLNLQRTSIRRLPSSIVSLCKLQTLILFECENLIELPDSMGSLIDLHHLDIKGTYLQEMPAEMGKLTRLHNLTDFVLGKQSGSCIKELGDLQRLCGKLCISNLQNVVDAQDASTANLKAKKHLKKLEFRWDVNSNDSLHERDVLEQLEPHSEVESLVICGFGGAGFPNWVGDCSFSNIVLLFLAGCRYCSSLHHLANYHL